MVLTRRTFALSSASLAIGIKPLSAAGDEPWQTELAEWVSSNRDQAVTLGPHLLPLNDVRWAKAHAILDGARSDAIPIHVAQYFLTDVPQNWIRAWPGEYANPIVVLFFSSTHDKPIGDTTPWCSAFVNWCLQDSGIAGTHRAGSQSFKTWGSTVWDKTHGGLPTAARPGDIAIFRHKSDPVHGHVAFFNGISTVQADSIDVVGGNHITGKTHLIQAKPLRMNNDLELIRIATVDGLRAQ